MKLTIDLAVGLEDGERGSPKPNVLPAIIEYLQNNQNGPQVSGIAWSPGWWFELDFPAFGSDIH